MAQPSPISTTPAFSSPALTKMFGPVVGNFFSSFLEFLYEQCSLHMTEKIPSSVKLGSRPRIFLIRSNSSGVRPCCLMSSGVTAGSAVGIWLIIGRFTLTNPQSRSITQIRIFIKSRHLLSVRQLFELRTLGIKRGRDYGKKSNYCSRLRAHCIAGVCTDYYDAHDALSD